MLGDKPEHFHLRKACVLTPALKEFALLGKWVTQHNGLYPVGAGGDDIHWGF